MEQELHRQSIGGLFIGHDFNNGRDYAIDLVWILKHKVLGRSRYYEKPVMDRMKRIRGNMFVDIGANIGRYSKGLAGNFKTVHAFEPNPRYLAELNTQDPRNMVVHPIVLSDTDGTCQFYTTPAGHGGSADTILREFRYNPRDNPLAAHTFQGDESQSMQIHSKRYDSLFPEEVDLVKVDVEGAEFKVLAGMTESLRQQRVRNIVVELHDSEKEAWLLNLFRNYGYASVWLDPTHLFAWPGVKHD